MKKTSVLLTSLCALGAAVAMAAGPVSSVNAVGYYTVTLPPNAQMIMTGSSFDPIAGGTNVSRTVLDIFGTSSGLRQSEVRGSVDRVFVWDFANQKYLILGQHTNGTFASTATSGSWTNPVNPVVPLGYGLFIQSAGGTSNSTTLTLMGQVPSTLTNALPVFGDALNSPLQMLVNPYPVATTLDSLINTNNGAVGSALRGSCDRLYMWDVGSQKYVIYGLKLPSNRWYVASSAGAWTNEIPPVAINHGDAFWYLSKTNFMWNSGKTYVWP